MLKNKRHDSITITMDIELDGSIVDITDDSNDLMSEDESDQNIATDDSIDGPSTGVEGLSDPKPGTSTEVEVKKNWRESVDISNHVTTTIGGIDVTFPFQPYPIQKAYMSKVLACIKNVSS